MPRFQYVGLELISQFILSERLGPSPFKKESDITKWLFICPSCHEVFNIGFTV
jgi:hypothetical protein